MYYGIGFIGFIIQTGNYYIRYMICRCHTGLYFLLRNYFYVCCLNYCFCIIWRFECSHILIIYIILALFYYIIYYINWLCQHGCISVVVVLHIRFADSVLCNTAVVLIVWYSYVLHLQLWNGNISSVKGTVFYE